jgi:hypothetical protein
MASCPPGTVARVELRSDGDAHLASVEVEVHVTDFPGVDEAEDSRVDVAVLHTSELRMAKTKRPSASTRTGPCRLIGMR